MNELEKLLNEPQSPKVIEADIPKQIEKPTPAANKANALIAQDKAIAAASVGSPVFRTAAAFLATSLATGGFQK